LEAQPRHGTRPDANVAVDHRVDLPVGEDHVGPHKAPEGLGPAYVDRHVGVARRTGRLDVREVAREVPRELGMVGGDLDGDAAEAYALDAGRRHRGAGGAKETTARQTRRMSGATYSGGLIAVSRKVLRACAIIAALHG